MGTVRRRDLVLGGLATASFATLPATVQARPKWWKLFVEAIIVGVVSGYVAGRVALNGSEESLKFEIDRNWHVGDIVNAKTSFRGLEWPSEEEVMVPAGSYEVFDIERRVITLPGRAPILTKVVVLQNHNSKRLVGVIYR